MAILSKLRESAEDMTMTEQQCSPDSAERVAELQYEAGMYQSLYENARAEIERLRAAAQTVTVTDAMCEAAINSDAPECITGSIYSDRYVIRDEWSEKDLWSAPIGGTPEYVAFERQVQIERMRMMLEAALAVTSTQRGDQ